MRGLYTSTYVPYISLNACLYPLFCLPQMVLQKPCTVHTNNACEECRKVQETFDCTQSAMPLRTNPIPSHVSVNRSQSLESTQIDSIYLSK